MSYARSPIGRAFKGSFNDTPAQTLAGHAITHAVQRAGLAPGEVDDVILGAALQQGAQGMNLARQAALRAGLPVTVPGMTVDRQCASGLMAIAAGARMIEGGDADIVVAGGAESVSLVQNQHFNAHRAQDPWLEANVPCIYDSMLQTAEVVARRYGISREAQDLYAAESQRRTAAAQERGAFDAEIVPLPLHQPGQQDDAPADSTGALSRDEGNRPETTVETLARLGPVLNRDGRHPGRFSVTAGNASQLSDGAAALVLMEAAEASRRDLEPLGIFHGVAVTGCAPDEMGIGPVTAVPKLLARHGLTVDDIDLWELNEAFASQTLYCRDALGIDPERFNVDGGAISVGHPYGMSGARMAGHALHATRERGGKHAVVTMCIGGGMGAAGLFEAL
ncbi:acetyl-CoA C-acyltransferase [Arthrobacter sp. NPDC089319]|uniref:acetyl-CoA C-acyltransferase n=1 Tax=Arthrobacter sp. NPDC089319 TaxID=3155915 RepID=UPI003443B13A